MPLLDDLRAKVMKGRKRPKGIVCPCCGQKAKLYKYTFNTIMGASAVWLHYASKHGEDVDGWVHVPSTAPPFIIKGRVFDKLARWGLAVDRVNHDPVKRCSGMWKLTKRGRRFVRGLVEVPSFALLYNGKAEGFSVTLVGVKDVLGTVFNYKKMMSGVFDEPHKQ